MAARRSFFSAAVDFSPVRKCSARGCQESAIWALRWRNPKIHEPERRKVWLACDAHREHLSDFLAARGFLREVDRSLDG